MDTVHVVAFNGSPRRHGNTVTLMNWVLEGCQGAGCDSEWIHIADCKIRYCQGCFTCLREGSCPIDDDFQAVRSKLLEAQGIIIGSPVYGDAPTAQLKTFLDRLCLLNLFVYLFKDHHSVGVATSGVAPTGGVARSLAILFGQPSGFIGATTSSRARGYQNLGEYHKKNLPGKARALGRRLVMDIRSPRRFNLPLREILMHRFLSQAVLRPMVTSNPEQFAGVMSLWEANGWSPIISTRKNRLKGLSG